MREPRWRMEADATGRTSPVAAEKSTEFGSSGERNREQPGLDIEKEHTGERCLERLAMSGVFSTQD